jgi:hypothetical protein
MLKGPPRTIKPRCFVNNEPQPAAAHRPLSAKNRTLYREVAAFFSAREQELNKKRIAVGQLAYEMAMKDTRKQFNMKTRDVTTALKRMGYTPITPPRGY